MSSKHRRQAGLGDALGLHHRSELRRLEMREHVQAADHAHRPDREGIDQVEHRRRVKPDVLRVQLQRDDRVDGAGGEVLLGEAYALRLAGGAAGEEDLRNVGGLALDRARQGIALGEEALVRCVRARQFRVVPGDHRHRPVIRQRLEQELGLGHRKDACHFRRREPDVERHENDAGIGAGEIDLEIAEAVAREDRDPVAWIDAAGLQRAGKLRRASRKLAIAEARAVDVDHCRTAREQRRRAIDDPGEGDHVTPPPPSLPPAPPARRDA
jgi:hypothetical protein